MSKEVKHDGVVKRIEEDTLFVSIINKSACASCAVSGACNVSEMSEKIIEVNSYGVPYTIGEKVEVSLKEELGFRALLIGYLLPFILVMFIMVIGTSFSKNELLVGLISLSVLVPYYGFLSFFKARIKKRFSFFVNKM